jgi:heat shock protein HslJ
MAGWLAMSCAPAQKAVTAEDLQHHRWVLDSVNGEALPTIDGPGKIPELDFGEHMTVSGNAGCNQMNGKAVLRDGFFLIEAMASTRMMCPPPWGDLERTMQILLGSESTISIGSDKALTLVSPSTTLVFQLQDWK